MRKKSLRSCRLYLILDKEIAANNLLRIAKEVATSRIDIVQFRDKYSSDRDFYNLAIQLKKIFAKTDKLFIINDRVDIAKIIDADGVHLGQEDLTPNLAGKVLGKKKVIGLSCHNLTQVKEAKRQDLDYISIGPIFKTPLRPNYKALGLGLIKKAKDYIDIPFFSIGGISLQNIDLITSLGLNKIAVCRAICKAKDIKGTARSLKEKLITLNCYCPN